MKYNITRRNAVKGLAVSGAMVGVPLPVLAGAKRGGTIRVAVGGGSATDAFDPTLNAGLMNGYMHLVYNRLVQEVADTGQLVPELATSWESQNKNKEWIFNLRKGVTFSDGSQFNADDVIYSILLHTKEGTKSGGKGYLLDLKSVEKLSPHQVKFTFNNANPDVPAVLSLYNFVIIKNGHTDWSRANGTGGYTISKFEAGVRVIANRRPEYWRKNSAWADVIDIVYINDINSTVNALLSGGVDICANIPTTIVKKLEKVTSINVIISDGKGHFTWPMMQNKAPFDNPNIRKAIKYGMDRQSIVDVALNGYGAIGNDNPISSAYADYVPQKQISYDADKAKYYLKKAGVSKVSVDLSVSSAVGAGTEESALVFKENASKANIAVNVIREPADGYWSDVWLKKPFHSSFWNGRPTATLMFDTAYVSSSKWNESEFRNKNFDRLIKDAKEAKSFTERKDKLGEAQRILTEEGSVIIPTFRSTIEASSNKIGGHLATKAQNINNGYLEDLWIIS